MRAPLSVSAAAHVAIIGLFLMLPAAMPSPPKLDLSHAVEVVFAPPAPPAPLQPVEQQQPPPQPPPQPVEQPPPPPALQAETPPPPPKPAPKPRPKPVPQAVERPPEMPLPLPTATPPAASPSPQVASIPPPAPTISADYRSALSLWLESHKHYPDDARQRGEEGRAVLRFRVDRTGRVLDYAVVTSTGFADLDAAVESMMRGATMPPFPPTMTAPEIEVSVAIRFGLAR